MISGIVFDINMVFMNFFLSGFVYFLRFDYIFLYRIEHIHIISSMGKVQLNLVKVGNFFVSSKSKPISSLRIKHYIFMYKEMIIIPYSPNAFSHSGNNFCFWKYGENNTLI